MNVLSRRVARFLTAGFFTLVLSQQASAVIYLSVAGSSANNTVPYTRYSSRGMSGGISMDMGEYLRLGFTHRQEFSSSLGYSTLKSSTAENCNNASDCEYYETEAHTSTNSVDLTVILYNGEIFVPYVMGGIAYKTFTSKTVKAETTKEVGPYSYPAPQGGFGMGIRLNKQFTLKVSHTISPGVLQEPGADEVQKTLDSYTQVGVTYSL